MKRRFLVMGLVGLGGCSVLPQVSYQERRDWPLAVHRAKVLPPRKNGRVLLVRMMGTGPGLETRGLQWLLPDGAVHVDFYEQWVVPPAQAVEAALRQWLAESGIFAAVVGPGSRLPADLILEPELTSLIADPAKHLARASLAFVLLQQRSGHDIVLQQRTVSAEVGLSGDQVPAMVTGMRAAVAQVIAKTEGTLRAEVARDRQSQKTYRSGATSLSRTRGEV